MKHSGILSTLVVLTLLVTAVSVLFVTDSSAEGSGNYLLVDDGDGNTEWVHLEAASTLDAAIASALSSSGREYSYNLGEVSIDSISSVTIGDTDTGGSFTTAGTTGVTVECSWRLYEWGTSWTQVPLSNLGLVYSSGSYALGFYPDGIVPVETPSDRTSWTMIRGNSQQEGSQDTVTQSTEKMEVKWKNSTGTQGVYGSILYANGYAFIKYGTGAGMSATGGDAKLTCCTMDGTEVWTFHIPGIAYYETVTPVILGDYIYTTSCLGFIFKLPWRTGPGVNDSDVTIFGNAPYVRDDVIAKLGAIPYETGATLTGKLYSTGPSSLIANSGSIYLNSSNGMTYCFDKDLNLIWSQQRYGHSYYISPTVYDNYVFTGALNGTLYVFDKRTGDNIASELVYERIINGKPYGNVGAPAILKNGSLFNVIVPFTDGRGMSSQVGGVAIYSFNGTALTKIFSTDNVGVTSNYMLPIDNSTLRGAIFASSDGVFSITTDGALTLINDSMAEIHAPPVMVNGEHIYFASYTAGKPVYVTDLDGKILSTQNPPFGVSSYNMSPVLVIGDYMLVGNDSGMYCAYGVMEAYVEPTTETEPWWKAYAIAATVLIIGLAAVYAVLRFGFKKEKPFEFIGESISHYLKSEDYTHNTRSKHRLLIVIVVGLIASLCMFVVSLASGPSVTLSIPETFSVLSSAIAKGGENLTYEEIVIYSSRLPRAIVAFAVGIGLSIAGSIYQAIIRNPMVDPYIMGVSSGAGTAAVAVIAFDFTFFGLFSSHSIYLTAIAAMVGGLIAFGITMLLAEKAGGSSLNYVLAGIVVGLAFGAAQSLMMSMAGDQVSNALTWLYGSLANISWNQVGIVVIPAMVMSLVPLIWAKELNLVLLGEDQAKQMGLNVHRFNMLMLILASVLTALCVAFCGIIGFVGLVIPHLCRMILGGDHRLVLPASIVSGGFLMMLADYAARMIIIGQELPVGAITTIIGIPVFAWLLIKRGKMYDG